MAVEKIIVVKETEQKMSTKGTPYLSVIGMDDKNSEKTYAIFDQSIWNTFNKGLAVKIGLEKKGNFWNVVTAESVKETLQEPVSSPGPIEKPRDDTYARLIRTVITPEERGMWWKEVGFGFRAGLFKKDDKGAGSYLWGEYCKQMLASLEIILPKKEVQQAKKSNLVEEIKKLGAVEEKGG